MLAVEDSGFWGDGLRHQWNSGEVAQLSEARADGEGCGGKLTLSERLHRCLLSGWGATGVLERQSMEHRRH